MKERIIFYKISQELLIPAVRKLRFNDSIHIERKKERKKEIKEERETGERESSQV
jgi:hypothetical protein